MARKEISPIHNYLNPWHYDTVSLILMKTDWNQPIFMLLRFWV